MNQFNINSIRYYSSRTVVLTASTEVCSSPSLPIAVSGLILLRLGARAHATLCPLAYCGRASSARLAIALGPA